MLKRCAQPVSPQHIIAACFTPSLNIVLNNEFSECNQPAD